MEDFKNRFITDALELIEKLESNLLILEIEKNNKSIIEEVFRGLHSLKGASGMYGFTKVGNLMHLFENVFEEIRDGKIHTDTEIIDLSLIVVDFTKKILKKKKDISGDDIQIYEQLSTDVTKFIDKKLEQEEAIVKVKANPEDEKTYFIRITKDESFEQRGIKLESIFDELDELGTIITIPIIDKATKLENWEVFIVTKSMLEELEDIFIFLIDLVEIHLLANKNLFQNHLFYTAIQNNSALKKKNNLEYLKELIKNKKVQDNSHEAKEQKKVGKSKISIEFLKVAAEKLDEQMDLLSELVTTKSELKLMVDEDENEKYIKLLESLDKITNRFRNNILSIRLVQIKTLHVMFLRLVRDISIKLDKKVEFVADGLETELDKTVIDKLETPLTHIIRNSLDHGIENKDERLDSGKPEIATIHFNTFRSGSDIIIEVKDDGRGIDTEIIRKKAIEKGLISSDVILSEKQILELIFAPGFSTAKNLSEISGRGVGMDLVKKNIKAIRGDIEIQSKISEGTTVRIKLPISLSIIDTLLIKTGKQYFAIPLTEIQQCTMLNESDLLYSSNDQIKIENELIPYIDLREVFKINGKIPNYQKVVIVKSPNQNVGLVVDSVIGEYQAVLRPFDGYLIDQKYLTGASLLADGQFCVILDTNKLVENINELKIHALS